MNAEGICRELGGHLTSIHSLFENVFLSGKKLFLWEKIVKIKTRF